MIKRLWDVTLTVRDLKRAVDFYERVLGLQKKYEFQDYAGFDCGGVGIGLKTWGEIEKPRKGEPRINFMVEDIGEAYEILKEISVEVIEGPKETPWGGRILVFLDPDGNTLQFTEIEWSRYFRACASQ